MKSKNYSALVFIDDFFKDIHYEKLHNKILFTSMHFDIQTKKNQGILNESISFDKTIYSEIIFLFSTIRLNQPYLVLIINHLNFIIRFMQPKNNEEALPQCRCSHNFPISNPQSQPSRFSMSTNASLPFNSRNIIAKFQSSLNKMDAKDSDKFIFLPDRQKVHIENEKLGNLKQTLNDLQSKIIKAKKQLSLYPKKLKSQIVQQRKHQKVQSFFELGYEENLTSIQNNLNKQSNTNKQVSLTLFSPVNTHYLSNVQSALQGKNNRALGHLHMSLQILQNQFQLRAPTFKEIQRFKVNLVKDKIDTNKKTLLIDIDQTLLRCQQKDDKPYDVAVPVRIENGGKAFAYITLRPYAVSFLKKMAQKFQIIAFTASHQDYADAVLDEIDPERELIKHRLYQKNCFEIFKNIYAKDLRIVNRDLSQLVLLDNSAFSYIYQLQNAIPVLPYYGGQDDEFLKLQKYLQLIARCDDVRELNKKTFKLHHYPRFNQVDQLVRTLYLKQY